MSMSDRKIFVTSDLHFGHNQPFIWEARGFSSIEEMNEAYVRNWNEVVGENDAVYVLGDFIMGDSTENIKYIHRLNGLIFVILGNHDTRNRQELYALNCPNIIGFEYVSVFSHRKYNFYLSHYPTMCSNYDDAKGLRSHLINLCGHTHTKNKFEHMGDNIIYHCEVDAHNGYPILLDDVIEDIKQFYYNMKLDN